VGTGRRLSHVALPQARVRQAHAVAILTEDA
jgi:hypothetical protein